MSVVGRDGNDLSPVIGVVSDCTCSSRPRLSSADEEVRAANVFLQHLVSLAE